MKLAALCLFGCSSLTFAQLPPHPVPEVTRNGDTCNLDWTGQNSITYFIQYSLDLQSWSYMPVIESGDGSAIGYGFECNTDKMFVRLHYTNAPTSNPHGDDFDNDGLTNWEEIRVGGTGTSPLIADTNGDGIRDDGLVYAAQNDPDGANLAVNLQTGLVGRWDFESVGGFPANFPSTPANTGAAVTVSGAVWGQNNGMPSHCTQLGNNGYLTLPASILNGATHASYSTWVKFQEGALSGTTGFTKTILSVGPDTTLPPLLHWSVGLGKKIYVDTYWLSGSNYTKSNLGQWTAPDNLDDGKWHHVTLASGGGTYHVYVDGQSIGEVQSNNIIYNLALPNGATPYFLVGKARPILTGSDYLQADVDRLRVYNRKLSTTEVQDLHQTDADNDGLFDWYEERYNKDRVAFLDDLNADPDRDDLTNAEEQLAKTDMRYFDTDEDLLPDGFEVQYGLDPLDSTGDNGATGDPDLDTLVNLDEFIHATAPNNQDTDGDMTNDNVEVANTGLPNDASDGGEPANPSDVITLRLSVGDASSSESERFMLIVRDLKTNKPILFHLSNQFGEISTEEYDVFRRGKSYSFQIYHAGTKRGETTDYDYFSEVKFVNAADATGYVLFDQFDPDLRVVSIPGNGQKVLEDARDAQGNPVGTGDGGSQDFPETIARLRALLVTADVDIDSNNNEGFVFEEGSKEEDGIETAQGLPGKVVPLNINDTDGVIDWADGFNVNSGDPHDDVLTDVSFIPFTLDFPGSTFNPEEVEVMFRYDASDPAGVTYATRSFTVSGKSDYDYTLPANGTMRIWGKNADEVRKKESIAGTPAGDFVPKDVKIKWSDLAESGAQSVKLYLEGVKGQGLKDISVDIFYKGQQIIAEADKVNVTLMKAEMIPDYNRDGEITSADRNKITAVNPWRFWINDDRDSGDNGGDDISYEPSSTYQRDLEKSSIPGVRDLIDYFPMYIDLKHTLEVFPKEEYRYVLKHADSAATPDPLDYANTALHVVALESVDPSLNADAHQRSITDAYNLALNTPLKTQITSEGTVLGASMLDAFSQEKGCLYFEVAKETTTPLVLEISHIGQDVVCAKFDFYLSTSKVEHMFRHKNIRAAEGGTGGVSDRLGEPFNKPDYTSNDKWFVFCHGYNVNGNGARGWASEFYKKLFWSGSNAKFYAVSWRGDAGQISVGGVNITADYQGNVNHAFGAADEVAGILNGLSGEVTVAAHSLGNMLVGSAIHDWGARPDYYYMIDAAVAKEAYDSAEAQDATLYGGHTQDQRMTAPLWKYEDAILRASEWHTLFENGTDKRKRLTWRNRLSDVLTSGVNVYNFYSTGEEVLANADPDDPLITNLPWPSATKTWAVQEKRKGWSISGYVHSSNYGGWKYNWDAQDNGQYIYWQNGVSGTQISIPAIDAAFKQRLKRLPYFDDSEHTELFTETEGDGTVASNYANDHRNLLLAEMIPATTLATGSNPLLELNLLGRNFDMPSQFLTDPTEWPNKDDNGDPQWLHSDIREVSYLFQYKVYDKFVELSGLDDPAE